MLQFAEQNPGVLDWNEDQIRKAALEGATLLGLLTKDTKKRALSMKARDLNKKLLHQTELKFANLFAIAELAQAATVRALYRGSVVEDEEPTEVMALELTAKLAAEKLGIPDDAFMTWHQSQFAEDANPQVIIAELEALVAKAGSVPPTMRWDISHLFGGWDKGNMNGH
jgi:hypothetical protein